MKEFVFFFIEGRDESYIMDMFGMCKFVFYKMEDLVKFYFVVIGEEWIVEEFRKRVWGVESIVRIYDVFDWVILLFDDIIFFCWWEFELDGLVKGNVVFIDYNDFFEVRREFYRLRGWYEEFGVLLLEMMEKFGFLEFKEDVVRVIDVVKKRDRKSVV